MSVYRFGSMTITRAIQLANECSCNIRSNKEVRDIIYIGLAEGWVKCEDDFYFINKESEL